MTIRRTILILLIFVLVLVSTKTVGAQKADSCTSPGAHNFIPLVSGISAEFNCWLQDLTFRYYKSRDFSDYLAANLANSAVQQDAADRLKFALAEIRQSNPDFFDQVMVVHGLKFDLNSQ
jgi:hypothetical protein